MKRQSTTISSKDQITVPAEVRNQLGLRTGDRVEFVVEEGRTVISPARGEENHFLEYAGALLLFGLWATLYSRRHRAR